MSIFVSMNHASVKRHYEVNGAVQLIADDTARHLHTEWQHNELTAGFPASAEHHMHLLGLQSNYFLNPIKSPSYYS